MSSSPAAEEGIGLAAARRFSVAGAKVLVTGRRQSALDEVTAEAANIEGLVADASDPKDARRTVEKALTLWGRLDVLVNNAGAGVPLALADATADRVNAIYSVNVVGPTLLAAAALRTWRRPAAPLSTCRARLLRGRRRGLPTTRRARPPSSS